MNVRINSSLYWKLLSEGYIVWSIDKASNVATLVKYGRAKQRA